MDGMPFSRRALVINCERSFSEFLRGTLMAYEFEVEVMTQGQVDLATVEDAEPDLVFVGVDLPDKTGFSIVSKIKRQNKKLPVVLITETLSAADIKLHSNLKVRADAFVDERTLVHGEFLRQIDALVGLQPTQVAALGDDLSLPTDAESWGGLRDASSSSGGDPSTWVTDLIDETTAALAALDLEAEEADETHELSASSGQRLQELEAEVESLRLELAEARREARSSPFSRDFVDMKEILREKETEILGLKQELSSRAQLVVRTKKTLEKFSRELFSTLKQKDQELERAKLLADDLARSEGEVRRLRKEVEKLERQAIVQAKKSGEALDRERRSYEETRRRSDQSLHELQGRLSGLEKAAREHDAKLSDLRREHEEALTALHKEQLKELAERDRENLESLRQANQERQHALEEAAQRAKSELDEVQSRHRQELAAAQASLSEELESTSRDNASLRQKLTEAENDKELLTQSLEELKAGYAAERANEEEARRELEAGYKAQLAQQKADIEALEASLRERGAKDLEAASQEHQAEIDKLRQDFQGEIENVHQQAQEAQGRLAGEWDQERQRHAQELQQGQEALAAERRLHEEDRQRLEGEIESLRSVFEASQKELEERHSAELEAREKSFRQQAAQQQDEAQKTHEGELEELRKSFQEELRQLTERHTAALAEQEASRRELAMEIEVAKRSHAGQLEFKDEVLKEEQERHRETVERLEGELVALRGTYEEAQRKAEEKHQAELAAVRGQVEQESAEALALVEKNWEAKAARVGGELSEQLSALTRDLEKARNEVAQAQKARDENAAELARLQESHAREKEELKVTYEAAQRENEEAQAHRGEQMEKVLTGQIEELTGKLKDLGSRLHETEEERTAALNRVNELQRVHTQELEEKETAFKSEIESHHQTRQRLEQEAESLKSAYESSQTRLVERHGAELAETRRSLGEEKAEALAELARHHSGETEALKRDHDEALDRIRLQNESLAAELSELKKQNAMLSQQGADVVTKGEQLHAELLQRYEAKIIQIYQERDAEVEKIQAKHAQELARREETLAQERKLREEMRQEVEARLTRGESEHQAHLASLEKKHYAELDAFQKKHDSVVTALKATAADAAAEIEELREKHVTEMRPLYRALEEERVLHEQSKQQYERELAGLHALYAKARKSQG